MYLSWFPKSEILSLIHLGVMILTLWGSRDVMDHVTTGLAIYGFEVSYRWSTVTNPLSRTDCEI